ncbi:MAG: hypothetical protein GX136_07035 [Clostridiales bacterium]|nr:hypothetical protein [Clostridiales bacterium]
MGFAIRMLLKIVGLALLCATAVCACATALYRLRTGRFPDVKRHPSVEDFQI